MTDPTSNQPPKGAKKSAGQGARTATQVLDAGPLTPLEEKVLRMRQGVSGPANLALSRVGQDRPEIAAQLQEMELRALQMSGRLEELRTETEEQADTDSDTKNKIIDRLKGKNTND